MDVVDVDRRATVDRLSARSLQLMSTDNYVTTVGELSARSLQLM